MPWLALLHQATSRAHTTLLMLDRCVCALSACICQAPVQGLCCYSLLAAVFQSLSHACVRDCHTLSRQVDRCMDMCSAAIFISVQDCNDFDGLPVCDFGSLQTCIWRLTICTPLTQLRTPVVLQSTHLRHPIHGHNSHKGMLVTERPRLSFLGGGTQV